jgi:ATP-dependent RNA helicase RhlE
MHKEQTAVGGQNFHGLGIAPALLDILEKIGITTPTPIQSQAIPVGVEGKDIVGIAQTGTGKTLAFGIPLIQSLARNKTMGLVVLPTRELALQVDTELTKIGKSLGLRTVVLIGGASMGGQLAGIRRNPHLIIATPGRLNDHLEQKTLSLSKVKVLVLDEADRMLDMGFAPQIERIAKSVPADRQTMLFSATLPHEIMKMATRYMKLPVRIEVAPQGTASENVSQEFCIVRKDEKPDLLKKTLEKYTGSTLVFTRTKHGARKVSRMIHMFGHTSNELHSDRTLGQRKNALDGFKNGTYRILVATDIAARGIDVKGIELVVNYDLPSNAEDYVHRIGRTGRAGAQGHAISFALPEERRDIRDIERLIKKELPVSTPTGLERHAPASREGGRGFDRPQRRFGSERRFGSRPRPSARFHSGRPLRDGQQFQPHQASQQGEVRDNFSGRVKRKGTHDRRRLRSKGTPGWNPNKGKPFTYKGITI